MHGVCALSTFSVFPLSNGNLPGQVLRLCILVAFKISSKRPANTQAGDRCLCQGLEAGASAWAVW